jgi:hypothetical protein
MYRRIRRAAPEGYGAFRIIYKTVRQLILWSIVLFAAMLHPVAQGPPRERIDLSTLGPQVGERVPDFSLVDQTGRSRNLQSIMGRRGAMLVFVRSADW